MEKRHPERMADFFDKRAETYDSHMLGELKLAEFYDAVAQILKPAPGSRVLDLGCGTGLELERLYSACPDARVTGIDLSAGMLAKLRERFAPFSPELIRASYFDVDLARGEYDCALSTYSLHHFGEDKKLALYRNIFSALKPGGIYLEGDYIADSRRAEAELITQSLRACGADEAQAGFFHLDTPFTVRRQLRLLRAAGFVAKTVRRWKSTAIFLCRRPSK